MPTTIPNLIIDTDVGFDDLLAITYLLSCPGVTIEAFTVVNGISDVDEGAELLLLLQENANLPPIPVYKGRREPISGSNAFPAKWRHQATQARKALGWKKPTRSAQPEGAVEFLAKRLGNPSHPAQVLAMGPLSNFGEALQSGAVAAAIQPMMIMGGAFGPAGAEVGNIPKSFTAEGNIFVDPAAAQAVFSAGIQPTLVPLNATSQVVITSDFVSSFQPATFLGKVAGDVLNIIAKKFIKPGQPPYNAWDPLAAMAMVEPEVLSNVSGICIQVGEDGATATALGSPNARVALGGDAAAFVSNYQSAFQASATA
jgi:inosine-uridine nucleoside N-ribohydrolase